MKKIVIIFLFVYLLGQQWAIGQTKVRDFYKSKVSVEWNMLMNISNNIQNSEALWNDLKLGDFVQSLKKKRKTLKSDRLFLNHVFYKTHRKYLHEYKIHASVAELTKTGNFDCVSGTLFYAFLFNQLDIDYIIKEFDYHVFLIIKLNNKSFLFESTDALGGYVYDQMEIQDRIKSYLNDETTRFDKAVASNSLDGYGIGGINNDIDYEQLIGLQYFNNAIDYYNHQQVDLTIKALEKALYFYDSDRIKAFQKIALIAFVRNGLLTKDLENKYFDLIYQPVSNTAN